MLMAAQACSVFTLCWTLLGDVVVVVVVVGRVEVVAAMFDMAVMCDVVSW